MERAAARRQRDLMRLQAALSAFLLPAFAPLNSCFIWVPGKKQENVNVGAFSTPCWLYKTLQTRVFDRFN
jgi:hypothetical protein